MVQRLCKLCPEPALPRKQRCEECDLAQQPVIVRVKAAEQRLSLVPLGLRRARVPERDWPEGRRWCSGCQTFVRIEDCPKTGSRCKTCTGIGSHQSMIRSTYGLSSDDWNMLMNKQGGRCAICRNPPKKLRLVVDHEHSTGTVRGLLCSRCNDELLGAAYHKTEVLENAIEYLQHPPFTSPGWVQPEVRRGEPAPAPF